jgi:hypothetical protein
MTSAAATDGASALSRIGRSAGLARVGPGYDRRAVELSWPRQGALVRGAMPGGALAERIAGQLVADELTHR